MFKGIIRKADILLAGVLILMGVAASLWISQFDTSGSRVIIKTDGKVYGSYSISEDRTVTVKQGKKTNTVRIHDGEVSVTHASCHNQVCVKHKAIHTTGESIICLPNKMVVQIQGKGGDEYDAISLLAALALIFSYVEAIIPYNPGVPGIKLGIANIVALVALYRLSAKHAAAVNVIRILIAGLLFNGVFGALYSLGGAAISLLGMVALKRTDQFSIAGVSMAGGVLHNMGQLLVAALLLQDSQIFLYFPVLLFSGMIAGIVIGLGAAVICRRLEHL